MVRQAEMFWASSSVYLLKIMKREYEFSKGVRGHFYRKRGELRLPIYLDAKLQGKLEPLCAEKGQRYWRSVNQFDPPARRVLRAGGIQIRSSLLNLVD
jgi:hypothetical protein